MRTLIPAMVLGAACAVSHAQLIRPDSATASSEFSGSYDVGNAIDGSGLPANFTLTDAHATYVANNHWTTRAGETIGQFATFTFNTAKTIGAFHMWNHRSNGVAANGSYEPVLFDLVFFDGPNGAGATLATFPNIVAEPNVAVAQSFVLPVIANVRSVRFIVRATENNNVSPYTGLAEVAFGPCQPVGIPSATQPTAAAVCPGDAASFAVVPSGSGPFTYRWQWRAQDGDAWADVVEGSNPATGTAVFTAVGAQLPGVIAYPATSWAYDGRVSFRAVAANQCGEVTSNAARVIVDPADVGSTGGVPGRDQAYDNNDFVVFVDYFFTQDARADLGSTGGVFGPDGVFDNNDFVAFIDRFFDGC